MFFIFGWNHGKVDEIGPVQQEKCPNCRNKDVWQLKKVSQYFTLFFIPVFPHNSDHVYHCPICNYGTKLEGEDLENYKAIAYVNTACLEKRISEAERLKNLEEIYARMEKRSEDLKNTTQSQKWAMSVADITSEELESIVEKQSAEHDPAFIDAATAELKRRRARGW